MTMEESLYCYHCERADVFSRGALEITSQMTRKQRPSLALKIQNLLGFKPLAKPHGFPENKNADYFIVDIELTDLREIVYILTEQLNSISNNHNSSADLSNAHQIGHSLPLGNSVAAMLQALIEDWLRFAQLKFERGEQNLNKNVG
jgi:hypothetical protein